MIQFISISNTYIKIGTLKMLVDHWAKKTKGAYGQINDNLPIELKQKLGTPNFSYIIYEKYFSKCST